jgi:hypothetical protein
LPSAATLPPATQYNTATFTSPPTVVSSASSQTVSH